MWGVLVMRRKLEAALRAAQRGSKVECRVDMERA